MCLVHSRCSGHVHAHCVQQVCAQLCVGRSCAQHLRAERHRECNLLLLAEKCIILGVTKIVCVIMVSICFRMLHLMIIDRQVERAIEVINKCPSWTLLNIQNDLAQTALHLAILTDQPTIARELLRHGANVDLLDRRGNTPLHVASHLGLMDCVLALTRPVKRREKSDICYHIPFQKIPQASGQLNNDGEQ